MVFFILFSAKTQIYKQNTNRGGGGGNIKTMEEGIKKIEERNVVKKKIAIFL